MVEIFSLYIVVGLLLFAMLLPTENTARIFNNLFEQYKIKRKTLFVITVGITFALVWFPLLIFSLASQKA